jgi:molybdopterin synthase sulfur carrier subunit
MERQPPRRTVPYRSMHIRVKLFAAARDLAGSESIEIELPAEATVADLRQALMERLPPARELLARSMFAINCDYAANDTRLAPQGEVACIPPVSGG